MPKRSKTFAVEFRLEGASTTTGRANMAQLGQVLRSWSDLLESVHADGARPPAAELHRIVAQHIDSGSHRVYADVPDSHIPALKLVSEAVRTDNMRVLPAGSRIYAREFADQLRRAEHVLRIVENRLAGIEEAVLIEAPSEAPDVRIKEETMLVGRLRSIGGMSPTLHLEIRPRTVTISATEQQAREIASHLYQVIIAFVVAEWNIETSAIESCKLERWTPGPNMSFMEGIHSMADHHGHVWDGVDAVAWLRQLRSDDE